MEARRGQWSPKSFEWWLLSAYRAVSAYGTRALTPILIWLTMALTTASLLRVNGVDVHHKGEAASSAEAWRLTLEASLSRCHDTLHQRSPPPRQRCLSSAALLGRSCCCYQHSPFEAE